MDTYAYTGTLTDLGGNPFSTDAAPELVVTAEDGFGPNGLVAAAQLEVPVSVAADGSFTVSLFASTDFVPSRPYKLRCTWFAAGRDGKLIPAGWAEWSFTAQPGGGPIVDMVDAPVSTWFAGPPWPNPPRPGQYWDVTTDDVWNVTADDIRKVTV